MAASIVDKVQFAVTTWGMAQLMRVQSRRYPEVRDWLAKENLVAQVKIRDNSQARYYIFQDGKVTSRHGIHPKAGRGHVVPGRRRGGAHPAAQARPTRVPERRQDVPARGVRRRPPGHLVHHDDDQDAIRRATSTA